MEEPSWLADSIDLSAYQQEQHAQQPDEPDLAQQSFSMMSHNDDSRPTSTAAAAASAHSPDPDHHEVTNAFSHCSQITVPSAFALMQALSTRQA